MKTILKKIVLISLLFYIPFQSMAWGLNGHRIVGEIADSYISKKTRKEIEKILGTESLAMASNWADFIKSDPSCNYLSNWHYLNLPEQLDYQTVKNTLLQDTSANAYTKINFLTAELKNKDLAGDKKIMYLRLLIHLAGDLHQPMHLGRKEDSGGNGIKLFWFNQPTNLHRIWDDQLIENQQLSYTEYTKAINHTTKAQVRDWQADDLSKWAFESYQISQNIYKQVKPDDKLGYVYNFDNINTLNQQLLKGGVRLAGLLNRIFS
jgi:S1/P1 Nuclease